MPNRKGITLLLASIVAGGVLAGCADNQTSGTAPQEVRDTTTTPTMPDSTPNTTSPGTTSMGRIDHDDLENRVGQRVTLTGEIDDMFEGNAFEVDSEAIDGRDLLVVMRNATGTMEPLRDDQNVRVSGTIMLYDSANANQPWYEMLPMDDRDRFNNEPVLVADEVVVVPEMDDDEHQISFE